jgi:hypothetical protein
VSEAVEIQEVRIALESFFHGLNVCDEATIRRLWHPDALLFLNNATLSAKPLSFLLSLPDCLSFEVSDIRSIEVHRAIAMASVDYATAVGLHSGFLSLIKREGAWRIAHWVDHGVEQSTMVGAERRKQP